MSGRHFQAHRARSAVPGRKRRGAGIVLAMVGVIAASLALRTGLGSASHGPGSPSSDPFEPSALPTPVAAALPPTAPLVSPDPGTPAPRAPDPTAAPSPIHDASRFPGGLLIADRGNGRLIVVTAQGRITWSFPVAGSLPRGQRFAADDAFIAPDGRTIVANDEAHQVIDRIDIATRHVIWQYGHYDRPGARPGFLSTPDDAYPLANGNVVVADIRNCRILEIAPSKRIVRHWGRTGVCVHDPPRTFALPNGDTPLPDGGLLITEIRGSHVVRLGPDGRVRFDIRVPARYPSDAQLEPDGSVLVVDYSKPGAILRVSQRGALLWRYAFAKGSRALDRPSLAVPLTDGTIALNDDFRARVLVIDPRTNRIVWQYGHTDRAGRTGGRLNIPDGIDVAPVGVFPTSGRAAGRTRRPGVIG